jgi:hypothetical protein
MMWGQRCVDFHADRMPDNSASILRIGCSNHDTDAGGTTNPDGGMSNGDQGGYPYKGDIASATYFDDEMSFADQQTLNYNMRASASLSTCTGCAIVSKFHSNTNSGSYGHFSTDCMVSTLGAAVPQDSSAKIWVIRNGAIFREGYAQMWDTPNSCADYANPDCLGPYPSSNGWGHLRWSADGMSPPDTYSMAAGDWQVGDIMVGSLAQTTACL